MDQHYSRIGRRSFLASTVGGLAGFSVLNHVSSTSVETARARQSSSDDDWTQNRADAGQTSRLSDGIGPTGNITQAWTKSGDSSFNGIAVVDGTVYAGAGGLMAMDAADGTERWTFDPKVTKTDSIEPLAANVSHPAVMNGTVYAGVTFGDSDTSKISNSALIAVDAASGQKRWRIDFPKKQETEISPVMAADGTVFMAAPDIEGGGDNRLYAFDASDGTVRWRLRSGVSNHLFGDGRVYIEENRSVRAYDARTGKLIWTLHPDVNGPIRSIPMVADGTLFTIASLSANLEVVIAIDTATADERWRIEFSTAVNHPNVYVGTVDTESVYITKPHRERTYDTYIAALNRSDGSKRWETNVPYSSKRIRVDGIARVGDLLYVGGAALDPTDGALVWTWEKPTSWKSDWGLSAVAGGRVYLSRGYQSWRLAVLTEQTTKTQHPTTTTATDTPTSTPSLSSTETGPRTPMPTQSPTTTTTTTATTTTSAAPTDTTTTIATTTSTNQTTATDGLGFGWGAAIAGIGLGVWRFINRE